jgi:hypothetical protein
LEEADVFDDEDDSEDLELEELVEAAVLDRDDEGAVDVLESEVPAKRFDDRMSEGKDTSIRHSSTTGNICEYTLYEARRNKHSRAGAESEYAQAISTSEPLALDARPTLPLPPGVTWLAGDEQCGICAAPATVRTATE